MIQPCPGDTVVMISQLGLRFQDKKETARPIYEVDGGNEVDEWSRFPVGHSKLETSAPAGTLNKNLQHATRNTA